MSSQRFHSRLSKLYAQWNEQKSSLNDADVLAVITGTIDQDEDIGYLKSFALFTWLFGDELQGTLLLAKKDSVKIYCNSGDAAGLLKIVNKKAEKSKHPDVTIIAYKEGEVTEGMKGLKGTIGTLPKEKHHGTMYAEFMAALKASGAKQENISEGLGLLMSVKDEHEMDLVKSAATLTCAVFKSFLVPQVVDLLEKDKKISHAKLSEKVEECILDPSKVKVKGLNAQLCDSCYPPIIQSGGTYDLRPSAQSDEKRLKAGCIVVSLGARYSNYCSNATRTYLIDASAEQEKNYEALLAAQEAAIASLKAGTKLNAIYKVVVNTLEAKRPGLSEHLTKNVGFGMGIEYREAAQVLNGKNERKVESGMIFNITVGLQNLEDKTNGPYALMVADTVVVKDASSAPEVFTTSCRKAFKSISYNMQDDEEEEDAAEDDDLKVEEPLENGKRRSRHAKSASEIAANLAEAEKRRKHQEELAKKKLEEGRARLERGDEPEKKVKKDRKMDDYIAYKSPEDYPTSLKPRQIYVDMDKEAVLLPINGVPTPFHIAMIKNVGKIEEGNNTYLRINFHFPTTLGTTGRSKADSTPKFPDPLKDFVKEVTFRSFNSANINETMRKIRELRRRFVTQQQEESQPETVVQQETLILDRSSPRKPSLRDVAVRPSVQAGKANKGILEAHTNGFRFQTAKGLTLDIIYSNIKHAFFQEADNEVIVLLHFNLRQPIMIKNKKTTDVQFYMEVMESAVKLNETRRKAYDQDELVEEQREREMRNRMNKMFLRFTKDVEDKYNLEFDAPYRELGFHGAPKNASLFLMPTVSCIVSLIEWPPFVLVLQDVEIAYLERVSFSLRNFDAVFVFKYFDKETGKGAAWSRISSIPTEELDPLKKFLDEQEIKYYEGPKNLVWDNILENIREDFESFVDNGGWNFLDMEANDSEEEGSDSFDEGDGAFEPEEEEEQAVSSESDSEDYEESDGSADVVDELEGDSAEGEEELSSDEEGLDWDELEAKAAKDDATKHEVSDDDNERKSRRNRPKVTAGEKRRRR